MAMLDTQSPGAAVTSGMALGFLPDLAVERGERDLAGPGRHPVDAENPVGVRYAAVHVAVRTGDLALERRPGRASLVQHLDLDPRLLARQHRPCRRRRQLCRRATQCRP